MSNNDGSGDTPMHGEPPLMGFSNEQMPDINADQPKDEIISQYKKYIESLKT